jgi:N-methylhydantoinase B
LTPDVFEAGAVSRRRVWRLNPADAALAAIGEDEVVELDSGRAAPLRGWARLEASTRPGTVGIDARGLAILKAAAGEKISLRRVLTGAPSRPATTDSRQ